MTLNIRPDDEKPIAEANRTGAYQNADEVIARALEVSDPTKSGSTNPDPPMRIMAVLRGKRNLKSYLRKRL
jgi:hypothetical protein